MTAEEIKKIRKDYNLSQMEMAKKIGVSFNTYNKWENGRMQPTPKNINKILNIDKKSFDMSPNLSDEELQLCSVPLLPIYAQGGALNDFVASIKATDCEKIISPIKGADFAITVSGESMSPEYPSGSQILIKKINEKAFIEWGKVYVLDTCNGTVIKQLMPSSIDETVICRSINKDYPDFEVSLKDVFGIYRVLMCMSVK